MVYHAGLPFLPHGYLGVDVFFVISGYLITGLLLRELASTGRIAWRAFVARRARRLLPAAVLVLAVVAVATWLLIPGRRGREIGGDIIGSALYVVNWVLAGRSVDYLAQDALPSPVQHYWSLAIEEQFYVLWPVCLILLVAVLRRRRSPLLAEGPGKGPRLRAVGTVLALLAVPSFAFSVWHTITVPAQAYFVTTTRIWELGLGAGLAVWAARRHMRPVPYAAWLGWAGLAAVVATAVWLPDAAGWPGAWALLPTLGTAAVILAGWGGGPPTPAPSPRPGARAGCWPSGRWCGWADCPTRCTSGTGRSRCSPTSCGPTARAGRGPCWPAPSPRGSATASSSARCTTARAWPTASGTRWPWAWRSPSQGSSPAYRS
jgi:peptidoglycan/LPS O-acetylase OafA/YrhL